jgi:hypothetical protein
VGDGWRLDDPVDLEVGVGDLLEVFEQSHASAEQRGCKVQLEFVEQAVIEGLLNDACATGDVNILIPCGGACLLDRCLNSICDEPEGGPALALPGLSRLMRNNEHRGTEGRRVGPTDFSLVNMLRPIT